MRRVVGGLGLGVVVGFAVSLLRGRPATPYAAQPPPSPTCDDEPLVTPPAGRHVRRV